MTLKCDPITPTPILQSLHWLPVRQWRCYFSNQPSNLWSLLTVQAHRRSTRSSDALTLQILHTHTTLGKHTFSVAWPRIWMEFTPRTGPLHWVYYSISIQAQNLPGKQVITGPRTSKHYSRIWVGITSSRHCLLGKEKIIWLISD